MVVSVAGEKEKVDVPIASVSASVARRFEERQKVLLSPGGAVEIGKKDKKPKGTHASVSDVDASYWPPSYMVREEGKSGHKPAKASEMVSLELALLVAADEAAKELVAREEKEAREREAAARAKAEKAAAKKAAREKHEAEASAASAASAAAPPGFAKPPPPVSRQRLPFREKTRKPRRLPRRSLPRARRRVPSRRRSRRRARPRRRRPRTR